MESICGQMGKLLNISVSDGFVNNGTDVPVGDVPALSANEWEGELGISGPASGTASFPENKASITGSGVRGTSRLLELGLVHFSMATKQHFPWGRPERMIGGHQIGRRQNRLTNNQIVDSEGGCHQHARVCVIECPPSVVVEMVKRRR